jgi:predicted transcriptional regulator
VQLKEMVTALELEVLTGQDSLESEVTGGYVSDLLSNVMGQAEAGNIWITMQGHQNIVAVASLAGLSAILIAGDAEVSKDALQKAEKEGIALLAAKMSCFEVCGRLYEMGIGK